MASSSSSSLIKSFGFALGLILFLIANASAGDHTKHGVAKEIKRTSQLRFYFHEIVSDPYQTSFIVARRLRPENSSSNFGDIRAFDNALREGPEPSSRLIGRAQGISVSVAGDGSTALLVEMDFVFTYGEFSGSTVAIFGSIQASMDVDLTIVGGSKKFRMARGYAQRKLVNYTASSYIVEFNLFVLH